MGYIKRENTVLNDFLKREGDMLLEHFGNHPSFMMLGLGNELDAEIDVVREWLDDFRNQEIVICIASVPIITLVGKVRRMEKISL